MKTIHHVVDIHATRAEVFGAVTSGRGLAGWWSTRVEVPALEVGAVVSFTFEEGFNPEMEVTALDDPELVEWRCIGGHDPWQDNTFRFEVAALDDGRARLRFWQHYALELADDAYGIYNFNWAYYLESLRLLVTTGEGKPYRPSR